MGGILSIVTSYINNAVSSIANVIALSYPAVNSAKELFRFDYNNLAVGGANSIIDISKNNWYFGKLDRFQGTLGTDGLQQLLGGPFSDGGYYYRNWGNSSSSSIAIEALKTNVYSIYHANILPACADWAFETHVLVNNLKVYNTSTYARLYSSYIGSSTINIVQNTANNNFQLYVTLGYPPNDSDPRWAYIPMPDFTGDTWKHLVVQATGNILSNSYTIYAFVDGKLQNTNGNILTHPIRAPALGVKPIYGAIIGQSEDYTYAGNSLSFAMDNTRLIQGNPFPITSSQFPQCFDTPNVAFQNTYTTDNTSYTGNLIIDITGNIPYNAPNLSLASNVEARGNILNSMYFNERSNSLIISSSLFEYVGNITVEMWIYPQAWKDQQILLLEGKKAFPGMFTSNAQSIVVNLVQQVQPYSYQDKNWLMMYIEAANVSVTSMPLYIPWGYNFDSAKYPIQPIYMNTWTKISLTYSVGNGTSSLWGLVGGNIAVSIPDLANYSFNRANTFANVVIAGGDSGEFGKIYARDRYYNRFNGYISDVLISNSIRANVTYMDTLQPNPNPQPNIIDDFKPEANTLAIIRAYNWQGVSTYPNIATANIGFAFNMNSGNATTFGGSAINSLFDTGPNRWDRLNSGTRGDTGLSLVRGGGPYYDSNVYFWNDNASNGRAIETLSATPSTNHPFSQYWANNFINKDFSVEFNFIRKNNPSSYGTAYIMQTSNSGFSIYKDGSVPEPSCYLLQVGVASPNTYASGSLFLSNNYFDIPANVWQHCVITRIYGYNDTTPQAGYSTYRLYVNGKFIGRSVATTINYDFIVDPSGGFYLAGPASNFSYGIDNLRLIKGNPWPINGFTVPTRPWLE
jgi:hypothetical protein